MPTLDFFVVALRKDSNLIQSWIGAVRKTVCSWDAQGYLELHPGTIDGDADGPASEREREEQMDHFSERCCASEFYFSKVLTFIPILEKMK